MKRPILHHHLDATAGLSPRARRRWQSRALVAAVLISSIPAVDIAWHLAINRLPACPWWLVSEVVSTPGQWILELVLGEMWVPSGVSHMVLSRRMFRWAVLAAANLAIYCGLTAVIFDIVRRRAPRSALANVQ